MVEKIKLGKTRFLELLGKEPQYTKEGMVPDIEGWDKARTKWINDIEEAFNDEVLDRTDEEGTVNEKLGELEEEIKSLKRQLKEHTHLITGEAVERL